MNLKSMISSLNTSILLEGREGLFMLEDAFELVSLLLNIENIEKHPDYLFLDVPKDKKSIGVDDVMPIVQKSHLKPALGEKTIVVINHMDTLTEAAQNKLLLSLEESPYLFIIGISYQDRLLETVLSRMRRITYSSLSKEEFIDNCEGRFTRSDAEILYYACDGCPGFIHSLGSELPLLRDLYDVCSKGKRSDIFSILHLVTEKDKLSVYNDRNLLSAVLKIMQNGFMQRSFFALQQSNKDKALRYAAIVKRLALDESLMLSPAYTKDNFFRTVLYCVEY